MRPKNIRLRAQKTVEYAYIIRMLTAYVYACKNGRLRICVREKCVEILCTSKNGLWNLTFLMTLHVC